MIDTRQFRKYAHEFVDWMADYLENIENYPVKAQVKTREIYNQMPEQPPEQSQPVEQIMEDFKNIIVPGMTHWQHPKFFAYFPANSSYPSVLAEMLTATLAAQCMIWDTSPAAAELEELVMNWLKKMTGLPESFDGVIQDTASSATLCALLSAREKYSGFKINEKGLQQQKTMRVYCSTETHSSIEKAVKIAGFGSENCVKVAVDDQLRLDTAKLQTAIENDLKDGKQPLCVVATLGTTGTVAIDPLKEIAAICKKYDLWLHVDAAFAGSALVLQEYRSMIEGIESVDSFVFNPHKWMFTNFDCSAYFVKDKSVLIRTFEILPEYLKTKSYKKVNDYRDWGIALGRRFRALKLWFVIRSFGVDGIRRRIREHIALAAYLAGEISADQNFAHVMPVSLNLICFRMVRPEADLSELNRLNEQLLERLNGSGKLFLTHIRIKGIYTLRLVIGQTYVRRRHVDEAWMTIKETANALLNSE